MQSFVTVMETIGSVVGVLLTLITFFGIISKRPKNWFKNLIREQSAEANKPLVEKLEIIEKETMAGKERDLALIRNNITHIYQKYCKEKKIPHYEKENVLYLYEEYKKLKGNSYVQNIVNEIKAWEEIF